MTDSDHDPLIRFLLPEAKARGALIHAEQIVATGAHIHGLHGELATLFGEVLIGSILLLSIGKGGVRQVLQLDGEHGAVRRLLAESRRGAVRGHLITTDEKQAAKTPHGLHRWLGSRILCSTVRDLGFGTPYVSTIQHDGDFLSDHLLHYLRQSVQVEAEIIIRNRTGLLIEAMPGATDRDWKAVLRCLGSIPDEAFSSGNTPVIAEGLAALGYREVGVDHYGYRCSCDAGEMARKIAALPPEQISELLDEQGKVSVQCQYCGNSYSVTPAPAPQPEASSH